MQNTLPRSTKLFHTRQALLDFLDPQTAVYRSVLTTPSAYYSERKVNALFSNCMCGCRKEFSIVQHDSTSSGTLFNLFGGSQVNFRKSELADFYVSQCPFNCEWCAFTNRGGDKFAK